MNDSPADILGSDAINAIFTSPAIDGRFEGLLAEVAASLGRRRPLVLLAFAPRTAGTFLRTAAIEAAGGQTMRFVHAEGGRDGALYLPWLIAYFSGCLTKDIAVTHTHMPASAAARYIIDAFDMRPTFMRRSIPDSLRSLLAMIEDDETVPVGFSFLVPPGFTQMSPQLRADIMIDFVGPWFVQFYASWKAYAEAKPERVLILDYDEFCETPADTLEQLLAHARVPQPYARCMAAIETVWEERALFRCNRGRPHRTAPPFTAAQLTRLERFAACYETLDDWRDVLLTPSA